ncbi:MAG TPA: glycoside hydrolase family 30 beta sandwich domain-containing protein [Armatimonadaceae bacterium]|nr:glycoside hydrolase family 30 beta sandwich domain-containing protein [Armatimonadaceae bacterium]
MSRAPAAAGRAWVTTPDRRLLLQSAPVSAVPRDADVIAVDEDRRDQPMLGFGAALTDSSAWLLDRLPAAKREETLRDLFDPKTGNGFSVVRVPVGASDFSTRGSYTYHDLAPGESDPQLARFSIAHDQRYTLPLLRRIRQINPALVVMASPWTAPAWMKKSRHLHGGWLDWAAYPAYARYLVKFLEAYAAEGVPVDYLTIQNEPRHETKSYPSMRMEPRDQARFVRDHLGPALARSTLRTKLLAWDHNWDAPEYPVEVLGDEGARRYLAGAAYHAYAGRPEAQDMLRRAFPDAEIHFTESSGGAWATDFGANLRWDVETLIVGAVRHGARTVLKWNLALDPAHGPRNGGCDNCRGVLTVDPKTGTVARNEEYYAFGHASRFVRPGAHRIGSSEPSDLPNAAFRNPDGWRVLVCADKRGVERTVAVRDGATADAFALTLPAGGIATVTW